VDDLIGCLLADDSGALASNDREYLVEARHAIRQDLQHAEQISALEEKSEAGELTAGETAELDRLRGIWGDADWQGFVDRAERLVLNYCIAHPDLRDPQGKPLAGFKSLTPLMQRSAGRVVSPKQTDDAPGWLGLQLTWSSSGVYVDGVDNRSPAYGRLRHGDVIERIDGTATATLDGQAWAAKLLAGPKGAPVWLRVKRDPLRAAELVTVFRAARPLG
jgi:hypothetical protein